MRSSSPLRRISRHRHDRHVGQLLVAADHADQVEPADVRQLDVGDHQVGREAARRVERVAAVGHRLGLVAVRREQVAEQLDVERIVLDDQDLGQFAPFT